MFWRALIFIVCFAIGSFNVFSFPIATNTAVISVGARPSSSWTDFSWLWLNSDYQQIRVEFLGVTTQNLQSIALKLNYPLNGPSYLTIQNGVVLETPTSVVYSLPSPISFTNIPPPNSYYAEFLAISRNNETRTLARGQIKVEWSVYSTTNLALWNPIQITYTVTDAVIIVEHDPIFISSVAYNITASQTSQWGTAYSWGNHAVAGYMLESNWVVQSNLFVNRDNILSNNLMVLSNYVGVSLAGLYLATNNLNSRFQFYEYTNQVRDAEGKIFKITGTPQAESVLVFDPNSLTAFFSTNFGGVPQAPVTYGTTTISNTGTNIIIFSNAFENIPNCFVQIKEQVGYMVSPEIFDVEPTGFKVRFLNSSGLETNPFSFNWIAGFGIVLFSGRGSGVATNFGITTNTVYRGDWGNFCSNQILILQSATNSLNSNVLELRNATNHLSISKAQTGTIMSANGTVYQITNNPSSEQMLVFNPTVSKAYFVDIPSGGGSVSYGTTSNDAYRGDWGNNLSNRVLALETGVVNIYFGIDSNSAYRGDWGNSVSNQVQNLSFSPKWILRNTNSSFVQAVSVGSEIVVQYPDLITNAFCVITNSRVLIQKSGFYIITANTYFDCNPTTNETSIRLNIISSNTVSGVIVYQSLSDLRLRAPRNAQYYAPLVSGVIYLNSNDYVWIRFPNTASDIVITNRGGAVCHFSGYYLGE